MHETTSHGKKQAVRLSSEKESGAETGLFYETHSVHENSHRVPPHGYIQKLTNEPSFQALPAIPFADLGSTLEKQTWRQFSSERRIPVQSFNRPT